MKIITLPSGSRKEVSSEFERMEDALLAGYRYSYWDREHQEHVVILKDAAEWSYGIVKNDLHEGVTIRNDDGLLDGILLQDGTFVPRNPGEYHTDMCKRIGKEVIGMYVDEEDLYNKCGAILFLYLDHFKIPFDTTKDSGIAYSESIEFSEQQKDFIRKCRYHLNLKMMIHMPSEIRKEFGLMDLHCYRARSCEKISYEESWSYWRGFGCPKKGHCKKEE